MSENVNTLSDGLSLQSRDLTEDEYIQKLVGYTQTILNKTFPENKEKRTIRIYRDRINFACPLCGDSGYNQYKKRGNIILTGKFANRYKCHNCGVSMPADRFFEKAKLGKVDTDVVIYVKKHIHKQVSLDASINTAEMLFDVETIEEISIDRIAFKQRLGLLDCDGVTDGENRGYAYLVGRSQYDYKKFLYDKVNDILYILNLTPSGKIFGYQTREMNDFRAKRFGKYKTYSIKKIHQTILDDLDDNQELIELCDRFEQYSMVFNVLLVNYERPVFVTEGPMDALLIRNAIALCGGSKSLELDADMYYIYDSDPAGVKYAIDKVREGGRVFMWKVFIRDIGLPERKKWDWNDVVLYMRKNIVPDVSKYFTKDKLDAMSL